MKKFLLFTLYLPTMMFAQPALGPHIGLTAPPLTTDPICSVPVYNGEFDTTGFDVGELVPDFTLYKTNGDSVRLSDALALGKPILLVGGNYTCPVFRQKIDALNDITNYYAGQLQVYVVYGIEAHTITDPSPYSGSVWITADNVAEGVLYEQPDTYGERLTMIDSLLANYTVVPEILVDGPCNEWWLNYGPAPNNAYLIDTNGVVSAKHGWFHRAPDNMWCDIDSLLGTSSGNCITVGNNGTFSFSLDTGDSTAYGLTGEVLAIHGMLRNLSSTDNVEINILKQFVDLPGDWTSAFCGDVCYSTGVSSVDITLAPEDSLHFIFYFYTGTIPPDSGYVKVRFHNLNVGGNNVIQRYFGITTGTAGINETESKDLRIFPNPVQNFFSFSAPDLIGEQFMLYDQLGKIILSGQILSEKTEISMFDVPAGLYYLKVGNKGYNYKIIKSL